MIRSIFIWLAGLALLMGAGLVKLRDGQTIEGDVRLDDGAVVVRPAAGGAAVRVPLDSLQQAVLQSGPGPQHPVGTATGALPDGWKSADVGAVRGKGSATCDAKGVFTINASGWGPWGPEDSLHFVYRPMEGDGQIIAHLAKVDDSHGRMTLSVMIRQDLAPNAPMAAATIHPGGEVHMSRRSLRDSPPFARPEDITPSPWVRLTRKGNTFAAYRSTNGRFWQLVENRQIDMTGTAMVGLAASMRNNVSLGTVTADSVLIIPGTPAATWFVDADPMQQGIVFRDGSSLAGTIQSSDAAGVRLLRGGEQMTFPWEKIARIVFNPSAPQVANSSRKGVWTTSGDFVEGEVTAIAPARENDRRPPRVRVSVRSMLLGARQLDGLRDVMAIVVGDISPVNVAFFVRTADGSVYRVQKLDIRKVGIRADGRDLADAVEFSRAQ